MHWTPRRERFRALLATGRCYHPGSVYDAISARIAEAESRADLDPGLPRAERLAVLGDAVALDRLMALPAAAVSRPASPAASGGDRLRASPVS